MVTTSLIQLMNIVDELGYYNQHHTNSVFEYLVQHYDITITNFITYFTLEFTYPRHEMFFKLKYAHIL